MGGMQLQASAKVDHNAEKLMNTNRTQSAVASLNQACIWTFCPGAVAALVGTIIREVSSGVRGRSPAVGRPNDEVPPET